MAAEAIMPQIQVIGKLKEIPLVDFAYNTSAGVYNKVKESNGLITFALQSAEGVFMTALGAVVPVASTFQLPIHVVDDTLCKGLEVLQEKVPLVKEPPSQIIETARTKVTQMSASTVEQVHSITNRSWHKANEVLSSTHYGNIALTGLDCASDTADQYIDYYLPAAEGEENVHPHPSAQCEDKVLHTVHTVGALTTKVGRRVYNRVVAGPSTETAPTPPAAPPAEGVPTRMPTSAPQDLCQQFHSLAEFNPNGSIN